MEKGNLSYELIDYLITPVYLAKQHSPVYHVAHACVLTAFSELGGRDQTEAIFTIPEIKKLTASAKFGDLSFILVRSGMCRTVDILVVLAFFFACLFALQGGTDL